MPTIIPQPSVNPVPYTPTFEADMTSFMTWLYDNASKFGLVAAETNAALNLSLLGVTTSSTTSLTIATGAQSLTVGTGLGIAVGMPLKITRTSDVTKYMKGTVTSYNSGTGALNLTVVTINGSGTCTDWTIVFDIPDAPAAPGLVLLETVTASASATVSIESSFSATYDDYVLIVSDFTTVSGSGTPQILLKQNGAYSTLGYAYGWAIAANAYSAGASNSATSISLFNLDTSTYPANFSINTHNANSSGKPKSIDIVGSAGQLGGPTLSGFFAGGGNSSNFPLRGIRLQMSSGTIATGTFKLYGIRKT